MSASIASWSTQQLSEFVAVVSGADDAALAMRSGVEMAAAALDADAVALVRDYELAHAIGWPAGQAPAETIRAVPHVRGAEPPTLPVPGMGAVPAACAQLGDDPGAWLVVGRAGTPLDAEEHCLLRAMGRTLSLAVRNHEVLAELRQRQRLLEGLAEVQHAISARRPLGIVLDGVVSLTREMFGDDQAILNLRDPEDPDSLVLVANVGVPEELIELQRRVRVGAGAVGRAVLEERVVVANAYSHYDAAAPVMVNAGLTAAMAAPVREDGRVMGALGVSSYAAERAYSAADAELLRTMADHVTLALSDAKSMSDILHQALHDVLTGLPNRALFGDRLQHALQRADRADGTGPGVGVLFIDLDRFKPVNDTFGHAAGDALLRVIAQRISSCLRGSDTAARLGGDEFAVLLEDLSSEQQAAELAQRVIDAIMEPVELPEQAVFVGASVGVATGILHSASEFLRAADAAMYSAKDQGRGRYVVYEPHMQLGSVDATWDNRT